MVIRKEVVFFFFFLTKVKIEADTVVIVAAEAKKTLDANALHL